MIARNLFSTEIELHCIDQHGLGFHLASKSWIEEERGECNSPRSCSCYWHRGGGPPAGAALPEVAAHGRDDGVDVGARGGSAHASDGIWEREEEKLWA
jgi:hypothetical protein